MGEKGPPLQQGEQAFVTDMLEEFWDVRDPVIKDIAQKQDSFGDSPW